MRVRALGAALLATAALCGAVGSMASAATVSRRPFGTLPDGTAIEALTLKSASGMRATIITLGASVQSVVVPDRTGKLGDVALGYPDIAGYVAKPNFFGGTVGRVANRIAKGRFTLDGKTYQVPLSDGPNSLHGGTKGFDEGAVAGRLGRLGADRVDRAALCQPRRRSGLSRHADDDRRPIRSMKRATCSSTIRRRPTSRPS